jgi:hypothetical protein
MTRVVFKVWGSRVGDTTARKALNQVVGTIESDFGSSVSVAQRPGKMIVTFGDDVDRTEVQEYLEELWEAFADQGGFVCGSEQSLYEDVFDEEASEVDKFIAGVPGVKYPFYDIVILASTGEDKEIIFWIEE